MFFSFFPFLHVFLRGNAKNSPFRFGHPKMQPLQSKHNPFYVFFLFFHQIDVCGFKEKKSSVEQLTIDVLMKCSQNSLSGLTALLIACLALSGAFS